MAANLSALLYVVSGVLFIMALRGLSHPTTSRQGNRYGMIGMALAILTTVVFFPPSGFSGWLLVAVGIAIGGGFGAFMAKRVQMTQMPQLVAFFHSLVGLAAVLVAAAALYAPEAFGIGHTGRRAPSRSMAPACSRWRSASRSARSPSPARSSPSSSSTDA